MTRAEFARYAATQGESAQRPGRNLRYYLSYWGRYTENPWFLSWNWAAFFLGGIWMLYRKVYAWAMLMLLVDVWISLQMRTHLLALNEMGEHAVVGGEMASEPAVTAAVMAILLWWAISFSVRLALSVFANAIYYHYVAYVRKIGGDKVKGGVNLLPPILWCVGSLIYTFWLTPMPSKSAAGDAPLVHEEPRALQKSQLTAMNDDIPGAKRFFTW